MFSWEEWDYTRRPPPPNECPWWMDRHHVEFIYHLVMAHPFPNVLEIGAHRGSSTSAFLQALIDGAAFRLDVAEPDPQDELHRAIAYCKEKAPHAPATLHQADSLNVIGSQHDLILVDGLHVISQVSQEIGLMMLYDTPTILAHDTNIAFQPGVVGSNILRKIYQNHAGYRYWEDSLCRNYEFTHRGFMACTRRPEVAEIIGRLWPEHIKS